MTIDETQAHNEKVLQERARNRPEFEAIIKQQQLSAQPNVQNQRTELERATTHRPSAATQIKRGGTVRRFHIVYTIYRARLLDVENVCTKYMTDALIDAGVIDADDFGYLTVEHVQVKCAKGEERVEAKIILKT